MPHQGPEESYLPPHISGLERGSFDAMDMRVPKKSSKVPVIPRCQTEAGKAKQLAKSDG